MSYKLVDLCMDIHDGTPEDGSEHAKTAGVTGRSMGRSGTVRNCYAVIRVRSGSLYASLVIPREDALSACPIEYLGQSIGPFFSGNGSSPRDRACPSRASNSSRVPWIAAGVHPIPSSSRISSPPTSPPGSERSSADPRATQESSPGLPMRVLWYPVRGGG
jgi:hypothetical protein